MSDKKTVSLPQAARELGVTWTAAYNALLTGQLDGMQVRGRWQVTRASVERLRRERVVQQTATASA